MACSEGAVQVSKPGIGVELVALRWVAGTVLLGLALGAGDGVLVAVSVGAVFAGVDFVGAVFEGWVVGVTVFEGAGLGGGVSPAGSGDGLADIGCDCACGYQAAGVHARWPTNRSRARRYQLAGYQRSALRSHARSQGVNVTRFLDAFARWGDTTGES